MLSLAPLAAAPLSSARRILAAAAFACLSIASLTAPAAAQVEAIGDRMTAFRDAYNADDAATVAAFYTDEAALLPQGGTPVIGQANIRAFYQQSFEAGVGELSVQIVEIDVQGDTAIEIGRTLFTLGEQRIVGRYMHIWKNVGGEWLIHRDIYNIVGQAGDDTGDAGGAMEPITSDA